jgi:alpha-L-fucosidase
MKNPNNPTAKHHINTFGYDHTYFDFQKVFEEVSSTMDPDNWADFFQKAGAQYVVMVTKHHDGYVLWPTRNPNPLKDEYFSKRDLVGELSDAVRARGMRMGHYYSGVLDWTFNPEPIKDLYTFLTNQKQSDQYIEYATNHWYEIIERFKTDILWNDIGYPYGGDINRLFAYYYNTIREGAINDRWNQEKVPGNPIGRMIMRLAVRAREKKMRTGQFELESTTHYDFRTPEYTTYPEIQPEKWETCRGIGNSFGYNQLEGEDRMLSGEELVRSLVDIVSKNGNLLLNVGPMADGTIPEMQKKPLLELGKWLNTNGEGIYGTSPWEQAEGATKEGIDLRFTQKDKTLYIFFFGKPEGKTVTLLSLNPSPDTKIEQLGKSTPLTWNRIDEGAVVELPETSIETPVTGLKVTPIPTTYG